jgi:hypothetical protein
MDLFCACFYIACTAHDDFAFVLNLAVLDLHRPSFVLSCKSKTKNLPLLSSTSLRGVLNSCS